MNPHDFPRLTPANHRVTSPPSSDYNCVAWAAGDTDRWWQPFSYWPVSAEEYGPEELAAAFLALGYEDCDGPAREDSHLKVALYSSGAFYTHAARQLPSGQWTSKLGAEEDIEHDTPEDVGGGVYGEVFRYMKRPAE